jgi:hypothetical protein
MSGTRITKQLQKPMVAFEIGGDKRARTVEFNCYSLLGDSFFVSPEVIDPPADVYRCDRRQCIEHDFTPATELPP